MDQMLNLRRLGRFAVFGAGALLVLCTACTSREPRVPSEELRTVPDVVGLSVEGAREQLEGGGFLVQIVPENTTPPPAEIREEPEDKCAGGEVVEQNPTPGEDVRRASTIVLTARGC